jgi:hypothetical protein
MWKRIKFYAVSAVIIALGAAVLYLRYVAPRAGQVHRVVDAPAVVREIQRLSELVTVKYSIQKVIGLKEEKVPFGSESILLMVQAKVLGGIDLSALTPQSVTLDTGGRSVSISLPAPQIMHAFVDETQTKVWDRTKTWWTPWVPFNPELEQNARRAALEAVQAAALEMGILSNAQQNAETTIREFLRPLGFDSVAFTLPESK